MQLTRFAQKVFLPISAALVAFFLITSLVRQVTHWDAIVPISETTTSDIRAEGVGIDTPDFVVALLTVFLFEASLSHLFHTFDLFVQPLRLEFVCLSATSPRGPPLY